MKLQLCVSCGTAPVNLAEGSTVDALHFVCSSCGCTMALVEGSLKVVTKTFAAPVKVYNVCIPDADSLTVTLTIQQIERILHLSTVVKSVYAKDIRDFMDSSTVTLLNNGNESSCQTTGAEVILDGNTCIIAGTSMAAIGSKVVCWKSDPIALTVLKGAPDNKE